MDTAKYGSNAALFLVLGLGGWVLHDLVVGGSDPSSAPLPPGQTTPLAISVPPANPTPVNIKLVPASRADKRGGGEQGTSPGVSASAGSPLSGTVVYLLSPGTGTTAGGPESGAPPTPLVIVTGPGDGAAPAGQIAPDQIPSGAAAGNQVLASAGSIVFIGPDGRLTANTGPAGSSGIVALGVEKSSLGSGQSTTPPPGDAKTQPATAAGSSSTNGNGSLLSLLTPALDTGGRSVAVSGFEDHSVSVVGNDQIVTYDDSNVFIDRDGRINANTGDTDSSGLNAVDVVGSTVRSGNSGDGEGTDSESEEEEADESVPLLLGPSRASEGDDQPAEGETSGSSDDEDGSGVGETGEDGILDPTRLPGATYGAVTDEGASIASGNSSFVIGADGYDDVSIRSFGERNIVSYDDSNVIIGGKGRVNAQIGDSDTGGAVVMGIRNSDVRAGCEGDLCHKK